MTDIEAKSRQQNHKAGEDKNDQSASNTTGDDCRHERLGEKSTKPRANGGCDQTRYGQPKEKRHIFNRVVDTMPTATAGPLSITATRRIEATQANEKTAALTRREAGGTGRSDDGR